jgi:hypothetical protein
MERELGEKLQVHPERKNEEGITNGISPTEARHAAMHEMDELEQRKE